MNALNGYLSGETEYEAVPASSTNVALGATGAINDFLSHLVIIPTTSSPGTVALIDGATTVFTITTPASTQPFTLPVSAASKEGAWKVTTGAGVTVLAVGDFT